MPTGLALPVQGRVPLKAVMWPQPITWVCPLISQRSREQGRVGADSCSSQANPASPRSVTLGSPSRLTGKAAVACSSYFFVCVRVYLFLDLFKREFSLQRAAEMWDVECVQACVCVGGWVLQRELELYLFSFRPLHPSQRRLFSWFCVSRNTWGEEKPPHWPSRRKR